jgi:hypothetical protein
VEKNPGTEPKAKQEQPIKKIILLSTRSRWNMKEEKYLSKCLVKCDRKKQLNNMAAVAATKEPEYFDEKGNKKEPSQCAYYHSGQGFSHPVLHSWHKRD